ncbi:MAG: OmpA family protein [Candidatus Eisenbacteria bacterium]
MFSPSRSRFFRAALAALILASCASCAMNNRGKGAVIGATAGGIAGGLIGNNNGSTTRGAIIGAVIGGAAGVIIGNQMDQQAKELEQNIPGATVERVGEGIQVTFESGLLFAFNSDVIQSQARTNLTELANSLSRYDKSSLMIVGHTDDVGSDAYNEDLSQRRASAAANYLRTRGVSRSIATRGVGEREPVATNTTDAGRQKNRRVEVAIYASEALQDQARRQAGSN